MDRPTDHGAARVRRILRELDGDGGIPLGAGSLRLEVFQAPAAPRSTHRCLHCHGTLAIHQPDPWQPARLLGVCKVCMSWFLMDLTADESRWLTVSLPPVADILAASTTEPRVGPAAAT